MFKLFDHLIFFFKNQKQFVQCSLQCNLCGKPHGTKPQCVLIRSSEVCRAPEKDRNLAPLEMVIPRQILRYFENYDEPNESLTQLHRWFEQRNKCIIL